MKVLKKKKIRIDTPTLYRKAQKRIRLKGASTRICDLGYLREKGEGEGGEGRGGALLVKRSVIVMFSHIKTTNNLGVV